MREDICNFREVLEGYSVAQQIFIEALPRFSTKELFRKFNYEYTCCSPIIAVLLWGLRPLVGQFKVSFSAETFAKKIL